MWTLRYSSSDAASSETEGFRSAKGAVRDPEPGEASQVRSYGLPRYTANMNHLSSLPAGPPGQCGGR
jgi:hypothetical protein